MKIAKFYFNRARVLAVFIFFGVMAYLVTLVIAALA